ncbi:MAG: GNAT family N-acetyltransferase [Pseudomonadota bacterium]
MPLEIRQLKGADLAAALPDVAALRITVFRDWPYLYDGDLAYEERYLAPFLDSPRAVLIGAFDGPRLVGASTATPLTGHADDFAAAFRSSDVALDRVFYCAESVLLKTYRGQGAGHRFFDLREAAGRAYGYKYSAFCAVVRPDTHALKPAKYRPLDPFWRARGYKPLPGVVASFSWKDLDQGAETAKPLQFWSKRL